MTMSVDCLLIGRMNELSMMNSAMDLCCASRMRVAL